MEYQKCLICGNRDAIKTNSHIIPSFLVAQVCSYDGSGKRDKEVMFTMTPYEERVYTGQIPSTKYEELFDLDNLTDDRIEEELKNNTASKDYIFCPVCEKRLSDILETPYSTFHKQGHKIDSKVAYMFWLSIVWRLSVSGQFAFRLPLVIEQRLGDALNNFMSRMAVGSDTQDVIDNCFFRYRLIKATDSKANQQGYLGGHYNYDYSILTYTIGDLVLSAHFDNDDIPDGYDYYGFEDMLRKAPLNDGNKNEEAYIVEGTVYDRLLEKFVILTAKKKLDSEMMKAQTCWKAVGLEGEMPKHIMGSFIQQLYSEDVKQGDRHSPDRYVRLFNDVLQSFGYVPKLMN